MSSASAAPLRGIEIASSLGARNTVLLRRRACAGTEVDEKQADRARRAAGDPRMTLRPGRCEARSDRPPVRTVPGLRGLVISRVDGVDTNGEICE